MPSQEEQKLNRKLAEWAGFRKVGWDNWDMWIEPNKDVPTHWTLDELYNHDFDLPDFPNSLDTCFKWLVPKLTNMPNLHVIDYQYVGFCQDTDLLRHGWLIILADDEGDYSASDNEPALAFCLAIEKLIDHDVNKEE